MATVKGFEAVATRIEAARENFVGVLMDLGGLDAAAAAGVFERMRKLKAIKLDAVGGRWSVKHGSYLDRDVLQAVAAELAKVAS